MQDSIEALVKTNPGIFPHLNDEQKTLLVCKASVDSNVNNFRYVPNIHRKEIIKYIMSKNQPVNILFLCYNEGELTEEVFKSAILADPSILYTRIDRLKNKFMTEKFTHEIIKEKPELLKYINTPHIASLPLDFKLDVIRNDPHMLYHFDLKYRWKELCELATNLDPSTIKYVPVYFLTKEMCDKAFASNHVLCRYIPEEFTTKEQLDIILDKKIEIPSSYLGLLRKHYFLLFYTIYPLDLIELSQSELTYDILASSVKQNGPFILKKLNLNHLTIEEWCKLIQIDMRVFGKTQNNIRKQIILKGIESILQN